MNHTQPQSNHCTCDEPYGDLVCPVHNVNTTNGVSQSPATDSYEAEIEKLVDEHCKPLVENGKVVGNIMTTAFVSALLAAHKREVKAARVDEEGYNEENNDSI